MDPGSSVDFLLLYISLLGQYWEPFYYNTKYFKSLSYIFKNTPKIIPIDAPIIKLWLWFPCESFNVFIIATLVISDDDSIN